jgi:glycosyltransferase involved in cell wall biosynthesis
MHPDNLEEIRNAVLEAVKRPKEPGLPEYIRERYTWRRAAQQLIDVYMRVLNTHEKN